MTTATLSRTTRPRMSDCPKGIDPRWWARAPWSVKHRVLHERAMQDREKRRAEEIRTVQLDKPTLTIQQEELQRMHALVLIVHQNNPEWKIEQIARAVGRSARTVSRYVSALTASGQW